MSHGHDDFDLTVTSLTEGVANDAAITITVSDLGNYGGDGGALEASETTFVRISPVNDPPSLTLSHGQTFLDVAEDTVLPLSGVVEVADPDGGDGVMTIRVEAVRAAVSIPPETEGRASARLTEGTGALDSVVEFTCPLTVCQSLLSGALLLPAADFNGLAEVILTATDSEGAQAHMTVRAGMALSHHHTRPTSATNHDHRP